MFHLQVQSFQEDEERTKEVFADFLAEFSDESPAANIGKTFVRGGIVNPEAGS